MASQVRAQMPLYPLTLLISYFVISFCFYQSNAFDDDVYVRNVKPAKTYYDLNEAKELFHEFLETYKKEYKNESDYKYRFEIFKKSLTNVNEKNARSDGDIYGITEFSDLTLEEFVRVHAGFKPHNASQSKIQRFHKTHAPLGQFPFQHFVPEHWDWRAEGVVTPVKNQFNCASCWAFSATGCVEGQFAKKYGVLLSLSEQQLLDCYKGTCGVGDFPHLALQAAKEMGGFMLSKDYPYRGFAGRCRLNRRLIKVRLLGSQQLKIGNEEQLKRLVYNYGPVSIAIHTGMGFSAYRGGIATGRNLDCSSYMQPNHAVLLVGYGRENGVPYWIVKNTAGWRWGEQGYIRLLRGRNVCNILSYTTLAYVA